jgi:hypothetical protein
MSSTDVAKAEGEAQSAAHSTAQSVAAPANPPAYPLPAIRTNLIDDALAADSPRVFLRIAALRQVIPVLSAALPGTTLPDPSSRVKRMPILTAAEFCTVSGSTVKAVSLSPQQQPIDAVEIKETDDPVPVYLVSVGLNASQSHGKRVAELTVCSTVHSRPILTAFSVLDLRP